MRRSAVLAAAAFTLLFFRLAPPAHAFSGAVSPARFEITAAPGSKLTDALAIAHERKAAASVRLRVSDWTLSEHGGVLISERATPGSCTRWVTLERRQVEFSGPGERLVRFEVKVPSDAPAHECRFAIVLDTPEPAAVAADARRLLLKSQIAVIVYVAIGDVKPALAYEGLETRQWNGRPTLFARFRNSGSAHDRPIGTLQGADAAGRTISYVVSPSPVLPGTERLVPLWPDAASEGIEPIFPINLRGTIVWRGGAARLDETIIPR